MAASTKALSSYADKPASDNYTQYSKWLKDNVGVSVDPAHAQLAVTLYHKWQASPENRKRNADAKAARQADIKARAEKATKASAPVKKSTAAKKPAAATPAAAPKKAAVKKTTVRKPASKPVGDAPF